MDKISGIYKIQSISHPERCYIGSAINIHKRWWLHLNDLKNKKHHSNKLQNHYNKYGKLDLQFILLLGCDEDKLLENEQYFLDCYKHYFNCSPTAGSQLGIKRSDETKHKLSLALKGNKNTLGMKCSDETKRKLRIAHKGKKGKIPNEETRLKMSISHTGLKMKPLSEEHKRRISENNKGRKRTIEVKLRLSELSKGKNNPNYGKTHTEEIRAKMRLAWAKRKLRMAI